MVESNTEHKNTIELKKYSPPKLIAVGNAIRLIAGGNQNGGDLGAQYSC